jgi:hypothetical protein
MIWLFYLLYLLWGFYSVLWSLDNLPPAEGVCRMSAAKMGPWQVQQTCHMKNGQESAAHDLLDVDGATWAMFSILLLIGDFFRGSNNCQEMPGVLETLMEPPSRNITNKPVHLDGIFLMAHFRFKAMMGRHGA